MRRRRCATAGERKEAQTLAGQQEKRLGELLDRMRQTVQDAEETEPLLARELFDTERTVNEHKVPDALKAARELVDLGITDDAAKASRHAGEGIVHLREGIERSAKSVLGDETAALKRAQSELEDLADQVNREVAQATGREPAPRRARAPATLPIKLDRRPVSQGVTVRTPTRRTGAPRPRCPAATARRRQ